MEPTSSRRRFLAVVASAATGLTGCSGLDGASQNATETTTDSPATGTTEASPPDSVALETLATGFQIPLDVEFPPDADRRYVADQKGRVFVHKSDGLRDEPFLDLRDSIEVGYEKGLLGMALHPNFAENRRAFVRYSAPRRSGTPENYDHTFVLSEFEVTADGRRANPDSERTLLEIPEPQGNHNAGSVAFGPDGYLYVGVGDGGAGGDRGTGHVSDWSDSLEGGNGQDVTENLLGSILRIDVDGSETVRGEQKEYAVPDDNPLVGLEGLDEHYAWGFRNPWRISFDRGRFFVADVGQSGYEEVNLVEKGGNYGWNVKEGTHCYRADDCPDETPASVRGGEPLVDPVVEYPHSDGDVSGASVIGGYVYRGSTLPGLVGTYVFGDLKANGRLFVATPADGDGNGDESGDGDSDGDRDSDGDESGLWPTRAVEVANGGLSRIYSFARDANGEVYVLGSGPDGDGLYRVVPTT